MFKIDRETNRISKLKPIGFSGLGFTERQHLQEWLEHLPDALGEELLLIQKEFAGFDDTRERLDLLAIDKQGSLVIIENKLDDSGRDVVWQALKYASYCSALSKTNIASIYQQYLDRSGEAGRAQERICEFLGVDEFEELRINVGNNQRIILVAGHFRKEVTSTVLWLAKHGLNIKCFRATPYQYDQNLFMSLDQVIPLAEAEELMIGLSEKEAEESSTERADLARHKIRLEFWTLMLDALEKAGIDLYANVSPGRDHWLSAGSGLSGTHYAMIFSRSEARVEFSLSSDRAANKAMFDHLHGRRGFIEKRFGSGLQWRRMDDKRASLIVFQAPFDGFDSESWPAMIEWLVEHLRRLEAAFKPEINDLRRVKSSVSADDPVQGHSLT